MPKAKSKPAPRITREFVDGVTSTLAENRRVRRRLPGWGVVSIDRLLPFLVLYRKPVKQSDEGTDKFVTSEAAYIKATALSRHHRELSSLTDSLTRCMIEYFGAHLTVELWAADDKALIPTREGDPTPGFRVVVPRGRRFDALADAFEDALRRIKLFGNRADTTVVRSNRHHPPHVTPLSSDKTTKNNGAVRVGLEIRPIYRDAETGQLYPLRLRKLRRLLSRALQRVFFDFSYSYTTHRPKHYQMLGKRAMVKAVWEVDRRLGDVSDQFDLVLLSTPLNTRQAWSEFKRSGCERQPEFRYRPLPAEPAILKRQLFAAPIERVEDTAVYRLLREKQDELDRQITMLTDRNTSRFLHGSVQVYGRVEDRLEQIANGVLGKIRSGSHRSPGDSVNATEFANRANKELEHYRKKYPEMQARAHIRDDIGAGLMVSKGNLLIGQYLSVPASRVDALLQHEIGTHVLTFYNGRSQPLRQLSAGLAGYEALQEGLAVFAEYAVGGLDRSRLRLLAARVVAAKMLVDGASFVDCFRVLNRDHRFKKEEAFSITTRIYRGGGLTKDAVYLRGFDRLLAYLADGGSLDILFVGKLATRHIPIIEELVRRGVLKHPPLTPTYMERLDVAVRIDKARELSGALSLIEEEYK